MTAERLHADLLAGVMAGIDDVETMIGGRPVVGVGGFAGQKSVGAQRRGLAHLRGPETRQNRHLVKQLRPMGQQPGLSQQLPVHPLHELIPGSSPRHQAQDRQRPAPVIVPPVSHRHLQPLGQDGIVAHFLMSIQTEMGSIEIDVMPQQPPHPLAQRPGDALHITPQDAMMDQQHIRLPAGGGGNNGRGYIHR